MSHGGDIYRNKVNIDFSINLNPLGIRDEMKTALSESLERSIRYPDMEQRLLREKIAIAEDIDYANVFAGCGASELIPAIIRSTGADSALIFAPSYTGYERALDSAGVDICYHNTLKESDFDLTPDDLDAIDEQTGLVFLCDPINPTGKNIRMEVLDEAVRRAYAVGTKVVLDESFYLMSDGCNGSFRSHSIDLLKAYDNLYILRSFTKLFCVPGIRAGVVFASHEAIKGVAGQVPEWNLPVTSEAVISVGYDLLKNKNFLKDTLELIRSGRKYLTESLRNFGFRVYDSDTSFVMFEGPEGLKDKLLKKGILIRECSDHSGLDERYYRVAVRTEADNGELVKAIGENIV